MEPQTSSISKARLWGGRVLSTLAVLFLVMDGGMKLFKPPSVIQATVRLGYAESTIVGIGITLLLCAALYVIPRTAVFGAILLTGILEGQLRATSGLAPLCSMTCSRFCLPSWFGHHWSYGTDG